MTRDLDKDDVKPRLLGHWGTCPGLNLAYAHTNALITELESKGESPEWIFVTGVSTFPRHNDASGATLTQQPGHGAPAVLSTLFLEGSMEKFYPEYPPTKDGLESFVRAFSFPGGFPSHVNGE